MPSLVALIEKHDAELTSDRLPHGIASGGGNSANKFLLGPFVILSRVRMRTLVRRLASAPMPAQAALPAACGSGRAPPETHNLQAQAAWILAAWISPQSDATIST